MTTVKIGRLKEGVYSDPKTGWSAYPFLYGFGSPEAGIRAVHLVAIYPGQVRGNHYHERTSEMLYIFAGRGVFYWEEEGNLKQHPIEGEQTVITIPPGIRHAFRNTGEGTVFLLAVRDGESDPKNPDVTPVELVKP